MAKAVSLLFLLGCPFLVAQSTSFDIKTGRWQFTETDITTAKGDPKAAEIPKVILDGTRNMPPDQRAKYLALVAKNLKANDAAIRQPRTTTESWGFCLDATKIRNGNLANKGYECRTSYTSGPNRI